MDRIIIADLVARCVIGVNERERRDKQDVLVNISIYTDLRETGETDSLEAAVDYRSVKKRVIAMVEASRFKLIEALAGAIANVCLEDQKIAKVKVRVEKPSALTFARSVGVEIVRERIRP